MERWNLVALVVMCALMLALTGCGQKKETEGEGGGAAGETEDVPVAVEVQMYLMSQCPYGVQALDGVLPAIEKIGGGVGLEIDYIGNERDGKLESMHGESEVTGNIAQLCAAKLAPQKHHAYLACMNKEWRTIPENWESCAKEAGIDAAALGKCKDGDEGKGLLTASFERAKDAGATGSPTIKVNGKDYRGGRSVDEFTRSLCEAFGDKEKPKLCTDIPPPPKVQVIAIGDERCEKCAVEPIIGSLKGQFPGLDANVLDYSDPEAKKIMESAGVKLLPVVLFDKALDKNSAGAKNVGRFLDPAGEYQSLRVGAEFDPAAEICDNGKDDTGDGKVDCDDETCVEAMACRPEKKNRLDVFVMSQCPYGVVGLNAMKELLEAFEGEIEFGVHFIGAERDGEIMSMHGPPEVAENIREICAIQHYPKDFKYMDYVWCRNKEIQSADWQKCTGDNGIKAQVIEKCSTGEEGKQLLAEDIKLAQVMKIGGSPTWLVNNRHVFNAIAAAAIQSNFCQHNQGLKGCSATLTSAPPQGAPQGGSCGN
ncbi:MAG: DsbA family protein [Deltaproteobacteria bacterium]|nr:DsbA family protein [Deltaproteobacteria bacterium]